MFLLRFVRCIDGWMWLRLNGVVRVGRRIMVGFGWIVGGWVGVGVGVGGGNGDCVRWRDCNRRCLVILGRLRLCFCYGVVIVVFFLFFLVFLLFF